MKVLFVYSDISGLERYGARKYYSGIGSLSAVLKAAGHQTALLYLLEEPNAEAFVAAVDAEAPDVVAFSATTHQYGYVARYAAELKPARPGLLLVCGGMHATLVPEEVAADPVWDVVCVGEGEYALRELADALEAGADYGSIRNLWVRRGEEVVRNPMRALIANLDELPYVDREVFGYAQLLAENDGWVDMMVGRGCPYDCSYCCNHALRSRYHGLGRYVRFRSVEHVMGELRALRERYAIITLNFQDDIFTIDKQWTLAFCQAYVAEFSYPFWINTRVERIADEEIVAALAKAHCAGIRVGVENGSEELRISVLKRTMSNAQIIGAFRLAQKHGLKTSTTNMIGVPGETAATIQATIDLNRELNPDRYQFSVFYPYPMTELHDVCLREGLLRQGAETSSYFSRTSVLALPTLSERELAQGYERFAALEDELALRRASPRKYWLYRWLLRAYRGDSPRLQRHLARLRRWRHHERPPAPGNAAR